MPFKMPKANFAHGRHDRRPRQSGARITAVVLSMVVAVMTFAAAWAQEPAGSAKNSDPTQQLFEAVYANDFEASQAAIAAGGRLEAKDTWGLTPIDIAIDKGYFKIAHFLLSVRNFQQQERNTQSRGPSAADECAGASSSDSPAPSTGGAGAASSPSPLRKKAPAKKATGGTAGGFSLPAELVGAPAATSTKKSAAKSQTVSAPRKRIVKSQPKPATDMGSGSDIAESTKRQPVETWPTDQPHPFDPTTPVPGALPASGGSALDPGSTAPTQ